jgi:hypothetical protein
MSIINFLISHRFSAVEKINGLVGSGIYGIETIYPTYDKYFTSFIEKYCCEKDLLRSGGSDFHGKARPMNVLGGLNVPYSYLLSMKERTNVAY